MSGNNRRGITRREIVVILGCIAVIGSVSSVLLWSASWGARSQARRLQDASQITGIHQSWLVFAHEFEGIYPTPGLIKRKPDPVLGATPGRGPEDKSQNTTANLFSACIAQNYFNPEMCVSPVEPSTHVNVRDYDWAVYNALQNTYWDTNFRADLHDTSNVSYAHMPLVGERKLKNWRESLDPSWLILGTRGPLHGIADLNSITNKFFPPNDSWNGHILFADNHVEFTDSFFCDRAAGPTLDNIFNWDTPDLNDSFLTFTKAIIDGKPVIEHD